jgi:hypothetical protein
MKSFCWRHLVAKFTPNIASLSNYLTEELLCEVLFLSLSLATSLF